MYSASVYIPCAELFLPFFANISEQVDTLHFNIRIIQYRGIMIITGQAEHCATTNEVTGGVRGDAIATR